MAPFIAVFMILFCIVIGIIIFNIIVEKEDQINKQIKSKFMRVLENSDQYYITINDETGDIQITGKSSNVTITISDEPNALYASDFDTYTPIANNTSLAFNF